MSTTVSYKGATLTTVNNATKTLLTEGKYLEDDITLVDVTQGGADLGEKSVSANGVYNASDDSLDGYSKVTVSVPASAVDSGTKAITANGNNQDVVGYAAVNVNVPNTYSAGDEGKVVDNGALVAQTSDTVTENDTYDTTLINSLTVNVSGGGGMQISPLGYPFILQNGTASARSCGYLSYSSTCIFMPEGGGSISANSSVTRNSMATDGEHVWIRINNYTGSIKYNGQNVSYIRDGNYFMIPIPAGFDGTIPFVIAG